MRLRGEEVTKATPVQRNNYKIPFFLSQIYFYKEIINTLYIIHLCYNNNVYLDRYTFLNIENIYNLKLFV